MKLPRQRSALDKIFLSGGIPLPGEFRDEYYVNMLTAVPSFRRFSHRKVFALHDDGVVGHNVLFGRTWGYFSVDSIDKGDEGRELVFNYNKSENSYFVRNIRDHVRRLEQENLYIGRFYYLVGNRLFFVGYFSLKKGNRACGGEA